MVSPLNRDHPTVDELQTALGPEFEVVRELGEGAVAVVYLAKEKGLDRLVAVKVLRASQAQDETTRKRFEREARSSASLSHPKVVQVYRYGRLPDDTPYLVMRYVKGRTMEERLDAEGRLEPKTARRTLHEVASALAAAHANGIVHRDIRPANVLWDEDRDQALLSDFGIAALQAPSGEQSGRLTQVGQMIGNPKYMSPEQLKDEPLTELADIYSFGVMGYELVSGRGPFDAKSNAQWITAHLTSDPTPLSDLQPGVDRDVADLLLRCLHKDPRRRPRAADIASKLHSSQVTVAPMAPGAGFNPSAPAGDHADLQELIKRRVPQIVLIAIAAGWGLMSVVDQLADRGVLGDIFYTLTLPFVAAGVSAATVIAWFHGEEGKQDTSVLEWILLSVIAVVWLTITVWMLGSH